MVAGEKSTEELRRHPQTVKMASAKSRIIDGTLSPDVLQLVNQSRDKGANSWLTAVLLVDQGLDSISMQRVSVNFTFLSLRIIIIFWRQLLCGWIYATFFFHTRL